MNPSQDGPSSPLFVPVELPEGAPLNEALPSTASASMRARLNDAPAGACVCWGVPFDASRSVVVDDHAVTLGWAASRAPWVVVMHTTDIAPLPANADGLYDRRPGPGRLFVLARWTGHLQGRAEVVWNRALPAPPLA